MNDLQNKIAKDLVTKKEKRSRMYGIISIILGLIPILLYLYCINDGINSSTMLIIKLYVWSIGTPILIISIILDILSLKEKVNIYAIIGLIITIFPIIYSMIKDVI